MLPHLIGFFLIFKKVHENIFSTKLSLGDSFGNYHFKQPKSPTPLNKNLVLRFKEATEIDKGWSSNFKLPSIRDVRSGKDLYPT
jgi:hypothetical protein